MVHWYLGVLCVWVTMWPQQEHGWKNLGVGNHVPGMHQKFCHLVDIISTGTGAESSTVAALRNRCETLIELLPVLTVRESSLQLKLYVVCLREKDRKESIMHVQYNSEK